MHQPAKRIGLRLTQFEQQRRRVAQAVARLPEHDALHAQCFQPGAAYNCAQVIYVAEAGLRPGWG